eukprot:2102676-Pyramimonas_sp.AAC.1
MCIRDRWRLTRLGGMREGRGLGRSRRPTSRKGNPGPGAPPCPLGEKNTTAIAKPEGASPEDVKGQRG